MFIPIHQFSCATLVANVGAAFSEIDWLRALSCSGVSFVLSVLTSLTGLPEVKKEPIDNQPPDEEEDEEENEE